MSPPTEPTEERLDGGAAATGGDAAARAPASLLECLEAAVCDRLQIRSLRHRSAALEVCGRTDPPAGVAATVYEVIAENWRLCRTVGVGAISRQNWRWREPQLAIASHNASPEVTLERALMAACERAGRQDWANQVPVASGIAGAARERRRAIDLVHRSAPGTFEFIELKVASDNPLYAAVEIIGYACIWLRSRAEGGATRSEILAAEAIEAVVLAPDPYYARFPVAALGRRLNEEMAGLGLAHQVRLGFRFEAFPEALGMAPFTDERLLTLLNDRRPL